MMGTSDTCSMLLREHRALADIFQRHQEAMLARDWARSARLLTHYQQRLVAHIRVEDEFLLSYAASNSSNGLRWNAHVYHAEHSKLLKLTQKIHERLAVARRRGITPAMLLSLLDEELTLKHVFEHHHEREEKDLFEVLPVSLPLEIKTKLKSVLSTLH